MSTTFNPYALVVMEALINTNQEIRMTAHCINRTIHVTPMARTKLLVFKGILHRTIWVQW